MINERNISDLIDYTKDIIELYPKLTSKTKETSFKTTQFKKQENNKLDDELFILNNQTQKEESEFTIYEIINQLQKALIQSNNNSLSLKSTLDKMIINENIFKDKIASLKSENSNWKEKFEVLENKLHGYSVMLNEKNKENVGLMSRIKDFQIKLKEELERSLFFKEENIKLLRKIEEFDEKIKIFNEEIGKINENNKNKQCDGSNCGLQSYILLIREFYKKILYEMVSIYNMNYINISEREFEELDTIINYIDNINIDNVNNKIVNQMKDSINQKLFIFRQNSYERISKTKENIKNISKEENWRSKLNSLLLENENLNKKLEKEMYFRRKIHNDYLLIRGSLRVMCRIKPITSNDNENDYSHKKQFKKTFSIRQDSIEILNKNKIYNFDYVFPQSSSQKEISDEVLLLVYSIFEKKNISIFSFGQTGTGKTYTSIGNKENPGLIMNSLKELFNIREIIRTCSKMEKDRSDNNESSLDNQTLSYINMDHINLYEDMKIRLSALEIYNDNIYNIIEDSNKELNLYEDKQTQELIIPDLKPIKINSYEEGIKLIKLANQLKTVKETSYNMTSSRSHTIFTYHIELKYKNNAKEDFKPKVNIVDLAGSERLSKSVYEDKVKNEGIYINLSLSALSNVLNSIKTKQKYIPFRDSKLTHYLKSSLSCNFIILLIFHISPYLKDYDESIVTLNFSKLISRYGKNFEF